MFKNNKEDIFREIDEFSITFFSKKLNFLIIGGGKASLIKTKSILKNGGRVEILAKDISKEILDIKCENLKIIKDEYNKKHLYKKHIIVICVSDDNLRDTIIKDCNSLSKIFLDGTNSKNGMCMFPMQENTKSMKISLNTLEGNPKGSKFALNKVKDILEDLDEFIYFTTKIRNMVKNFEYKESILEYIYKEEFIEEFNKGNGEKVLNEKFNIKF